MQTQNTNLNPLLSVIVLTYNQETTIGKTLDHILAQKVDFPFEVIVGEDASPDDNTRAVCERYAHKYPNIIHLMPATPNKGVVKNYEDCLKVCRGKYMAGCAGDDWWHNHNKLQMQVSFLEDNPDYGVVHSNVDTFDHKNQKIIAARKRNPPQGNVYKELFKYCFIFAPAAIYRRSLLAHINLEQIRNFGITIEDYPMWLEFAYHSKIGYIDVSTVTYCVIENSLSHSSELKHRLEFIKQVHLIHQFYTQRYPSDSPPQEQSDIFYNRSVYMMLLKFKEFDRAKEMVSQLGFSRVVAQALKIPCAGRLVIFMLESGLYRRIKKL